MSFAQFRIHYQSLEKACEDYKHQLASLRSSSEDVRQFFVGALAAEDVTADTGRQHLPQPTLQEAFARFRAHYERLCQAQSELAGVQEFFDGALSSSSAPANAANVILPTQEEKQPAHPPPSPATGTGPAASPPVPPPVPMLHRPPADDAPCAAVWEAILRLFRTTRGSLVTSEMLLHSAPHNLLTGAPAVTPEVLARFFATYVRPAGVGDGDGANTGRMRVKQVQKDCGRAWVVFWPDWL
jgi:hypothetical protein